MEENLWIKGHIRTYTGKYFSYENPKSSQICIEDIAHALSCIPRFLGHTSMPLSVAQHCVEAYSVAPNTKQRIKFLLHDAHEAYLGDIPSPLKPFLHGLKELEQRIDEAICRKFKLEYPIKSPEIKAIDNELVVADWERYAICTRGKCIPMTSIDAEKSFLTCYDEYCDKYGFR